MKQSKTLTSVLESMRDLPAFVGINMDGPNVRGNYGESPLHIASVQNDLEAIQTLIDSGADVDCVGEHGYTPLHEAVEQGNVDAVRLLLKKGAKKNIANNDGFIASDIARQVGSEEILALLQ